MMEVDELMENGRGLRNVRIMGIAFEETNTLFRNMKNSPAGIFNKAGFLEVGPGPCHAVIEPGLSSAREQFIYLWNMLNIVWI